MRSRRLAASSSRASAASSAFDAGVWPIRTPSCAGRRRVNLYSPCEAVPGRRYLREVDRFLLDGAAFSSTGADAPAVSFVSSAASSWTRRRRATPNSSDMGTTVDDDAAPRRPLPRVSLRHPSAAMDDRVFVSSSAPPARRAPRRRKVPASSASSAHLRRGPSPRRRPRRFSTRASSPSAPMLALGRAPSRRGGVHRWF